MQGQISTARTQLRNAIQAADSDYEKADYVTLIAELSAFHRTPAEAEGELKEASSFSNSSRFLIEAARIYAIIEKSQAAYDRLAVIRDSARDLGLEYSSVSPFIEGMKSLKSGDNAAARDESATSFEMNPNPQTAYFQAKAAIGLGDWNDAIDRLSYVMRSKATVFADSVPSLIPLAEYDLAKCYRHIGNESAAREHLANAQTMWKDADPDLRTQFVGW